MRDDHATTTPGRMPDEFDRAGSQLEGLPGVIKTNASTVRLVPTLGIGDAGIQTFVIQTVRRPEEGDTLFLEVYGREGHVRLVLPAKVTNVIARQRDSLTGQSRSRAARATAADRKKRGIVPGFMGKGGRRGKKKQPAA